MSEEDQKQDTQCEMPCVLHFTLGPVQGFVAQARRTRDLWAGSFLLSWLSGIAMKKIEETYGTISFPSVDNDPLFKALKGNSEETPRIGSLPNRFRAVITKGGCDPDDGFKPGDICKKEIQAKWTDLANLVWDTFVADVADKGEGTKTIWDQQIKSFWDIAWVMDVSSDEEEDRKKDGKWLDQRKNWRSYRPPEQSGDHCILMNDWSELSGYIRTHNKEKQNDFWKALGKNISKKRYGDNEHGTLEGNAHKGTLELGENERLCAIALVKRLFPVLFNVKDEKTRNKIKDIIGFIPCGKGVTEEDQAEAVVKWRSTDHMAATPWLRKIPKGIAQEYAGKATKLATDESAIGVIFSERKASVPSLMGLPLDGFDGGLFYQDALLSRHPSAWGYPLNNDEEGLVRQRLARDLADLQSGMKEHYKKQKDRGTRQNRGHKASPFYALLLADGDSLGALLGEVDAEKVSGALAGFGSYVADMDKTGDHVTIYAGGDDYLGLFPLPDVFGAATDLRNNYLACFENEGVKRGKATLSAAITFVPYDYPLSLLIKQSHRLLDDIAKEKNGRDSVAVRVLKSGGEMATWVSKWEGCNEKPLERLGQLAKDMAREDERSTSYLYNLRQRYGSFLDDLVSKNDSEKLKKILLAEYLKGIDLAKKEQAERNKIKATANRHINDLIAACTVLQGKKPHEKPRFLLQGAMIARFLADNGIDAVV